MIKARALVVALLALSLALPAQAQVSDHEADIQAAIERGNAAQVQAITVRDPAIVDESAVGPYVQRLIRANRSLLNAGATSIELVKLEWGPITVDGSTATATTFETWRTSYADG